MKIPSLFLFFLFYLYIYHTYKDGRRFSPQGLVQKGVWPLLLVFLIFVPNVQASYFPLNTSSTGNIGIGTKTPQGALVVTSGNVGIGTWTAGGGNLIVEGGGNVGIGTAWPGVTLDVNGSLRLPESAGVPQITFAGDPTTGIYDSGGALEINVLGNNIVEFDNYNVAFNGGIGGEGVANAPYMSSSNTSGSPNSGGYYGGIQLSNQPYNQDYYPAYFSIVGANSSSNNQSVYFGDFNNPGAGIYAPTFFIGQQTGANSYQERLRIDQNGNVGIGTISPLGILDVEGTQAPVVINAEPAASSYNVGIGSFSPGQKLDVQGTIRDLGEVLTSNVPATTTNELYNNSGTLYFNGSAVAGASSQWITNAGVGIGTYSNVGIGTTTPQGALVVTNGNVGIGTWTASALLSLSGSGNNYLGANVGIGSTAPGAILDVQGNARVLSGNLGIGVLSAGQALDVSGTVRATGFTMSGQTPVSGYVLTASDSAGDTTWTSAGGVAGWTVSGNNVYESSSGNVGIGTTTPQGALVVTNGNVGIGTWTANEPLQVNGNVGIGSSITDLGGNARITITGSEVDVNLT